LQIVSFLCIVANFACNGCNGATILQLCARRGDRLALGGLGLIWKVKIFSFLIIFSVPFLVDLGISLLVGALIMRV
jgi:hypothetical protein